MAADVLIHPLFMMPAVWSSWKLGEWFAGDHDKINGAGELMTVGIHGFLMEDPNNAEELAMRMKSLLDASLRSNMAEKAYALGLSQSAEKISKG